MTRTVAQNAQTKGYTSHKPLSVWGFFKGGIRVGGFGAAIYALYSRLAEGMAYDSNTLNIASTSLAAASGVVGGVKAYDDLEQKTMSKVGLGAAVLMRAPQSIDHLANGEYAKAALNVAAPVVVYGTTYALSYLKDTLEYVALKG